MILLKEGSWDWLLVGAVAVLSVGANLPSNFIEILHIDRQYMLLGLIMVVAVALIRYLKFTLLLVVAFLAVGANLPEEIAREFNIDPQVALFGLVAMVVISLGNRFMRLPSGLDKSGRSQSAHGAAALFNAILKGRTMVVQTLIQQGVNVNVRTVSGKTPLMAAAYKGYGDIVQLLIDSGADATISDGKGDTALKMALRSGFTRVADQLRKAGAESAPEQQDAA